MAKDKNSFVLYIDLINTVSKLPDDQAGKLFKIILEYVNDKNPAVDDVLLQVAFEPIKLSLKRDLVKWKKKKKKNSENGKKGGIRSGESRRTKQPLHFASKNEANEAVSVSDTVSVSDSVIKNTDFNKKKFDEPLTDLENGKTKEYWSITLSRNYSKEKISELWKAFCIQHEKKFYADRAEKINHFRNWIKTQPYDTDKRTDGTVVKRVGKSAGAYELLDDVKQDLASGFKGG